MTSRNRVAGVLTVALLVPSVMVVTLVLWLTATRFDHTEGIAISTFTGLEGSSTFAVIRWILGRDSLRPRFKAFAQSLVDLI